MTLATRLILAVLVAIVVAAAVGLAVADRILAHRTFEPLEQRVEARLAWLRTCIQPATGDVAWRDAAEDQNLAPVWALTTTNGTTVRQVGRVSPDAFRREQRIVIGDPQGAVATDAELRSHDGDFALADRSRRLGLVLSAAVDAAPARAALNRQRWLLWPGGIALAVGLIALLACLIRWQVRPIERMVAQIAGIGVDDPTQRLGTIGGAVECRRLAAAVDGLLARIASARERERTFATAAAHELRTPLAQLGLALEVAARRERSPEETRCLLADLHADVQRLQRLAIGLLQLATSAELPVAAVPLTAVLQPHADLLVQRVDAALTVQADAELLPVIIGNLLANARRYAPGAEPEIAVAASGGVVLIRVSDHGPGVPADERERIFAPLVRLDRARSLGAQTDGFGLGLAIARALVRRMGGDLVCTARPDARPGASFEVRLERGPDCTAPIAPRHPYGAP